MRKGLTAQRRGLCALTGTAVGFRAFYAVAVDGGQLYGSGWISALMGLIMALPVAAALIPIRKAGGTDSPEQALVQAAGRVGAKITGMLLFAVLVYDAAASVQIMSSTARYVAMPESNRNIVMAVTVLTAAAAAWMGTAAAADAALLWRRLKAVLIGFLILTQVRYLKPAWLFPVLGPGMKQLTLNALPAAGIFGMTAGGWLMLNPEQDKSGGAMLKTLIRSGLTIAALVFLFGMLVPGMTEEPAMRSFRLGRLLANDRAGLSLEMPYVVLMYGCMLSMLVFEMTAAAKALKMTLGERADERVCVLAVGILAFAGAVSGAAESGTLRAVSLWYFPVIALPVLLSGAAAWMRLRKKKRGKAGEKG